MSKKGRKKIPEEKIREKIETLRAENRKLRKEVQQLRKYLNNVSQRELELSNLLDTIDYDLEESLNQEATKDKCPKCNSYNIKVIEKLRDDTDYYFCQDCNSRGPIKNAHFKK